MAAAKTKTRSAGQTGSSEGPTIHDDFYLNLRSKITAWAESKDIEASYRDYILLVPDMFHFLTRLMMEPKVAIRDKAWVGIAVAYVLSPIDFIPDAFFPLGLVDDLIIMVIVLDSVLGNVPRGFVQKHWAGSGDLFTAVRESLAKADEWVGKGMFRRLKGYLEKQGLWSAGPVPSAPPPVPAPPRPAVSKKTPSRRPAAKTTTAKKKAGAKSSTAKKKTAGKTTAAKKAGKKVSSGRTIAGKTGGASSAKS